MLLGVIALLFVLVLWVLWATAMHQFASRLQAELSFPSNDRVYCHDPAVKSICYAICCYVVRCTLLHPKRSVNSHSANFGSENSRASQSAACFHLQKFMWLHSQICQPKCHFCYSVSIAFAILQLWHPTHIHWQHLAVVSLGSSTVHQSVPLCRAAFQPFFLTWTSSQPLCSAPQFPQPQPWQLVRLSTPSTVRCKRCLSCCHSSSFKTIALSTQQRLH
jgi:hypothetical protein